MRKAQANCLEKIKKIKVLEVWLMILWGELENETSQHFCGIILNSANSLEIHQMAQENTVWTKLEKLVEVINQGWWETRLTRTEVCFRLSLDAFKFQTSHGPQEHDIVKCQIGDAKESPSSVVD